MFVKNCSCGLSKKMRCKCVVRWAIFLVAVTARSVAQFAQLAAWLSKKDLLGLVITKK